MIQPTTKVLTFGITKMEDYDDFQEIIREQENLGFVLEYKRVETEDRHSESCFYGFNYLVELKFFKHPNHYGSCTASGPCGM